MSKTQDLLPRHKALLSCRPIVLSTHRRSGTHLTIDMFRRHFPECAIWKYPGEILERLAPSLDGVVQEVPGRSVDRFVNTLRRAQRPVIKTHIPLPQLLGQEQPSEPWSCPRLVDWLRDNATFCYGARDGREVMVSWHLYRQQYDSDARVSISEFLRGTLSSGKTPIEAWKSHVEGGINRPETPVFYFHETLQHPASFVEKAKGRLGLTPAVREPLIPRPVNGLVLRRMRRIYSVRPDSSANPGKLGRPKKWWKQFSREDRELFAAIAGDTLIRLGVEASTDWVSQVGEPV